jgi:hypothetical protein
LALADERQESVCHADDAKQIDRHDLCYPYSQNGILIKFLLNFEWTLVYTFS